MRSFKERDLNERVRAENTRYRNALISLISHDLRTPLTSIRAASSCLLDESPPLPRKTTRELLHLIDEESLRLQRTISNLMELTRLRSNVVEFRKKAMSLESAVKPALSRLEGKFQGWILTVDLPEDLPNVLIDALQVDRVLEILVENAIKYTAPGGCVRVAATRSEDLVTVSVSDEGPGVPPGCERSIFDPFFRATQSVDGWADSGASGTGLSLAISRAIIVAHGGLIWAENRADGAVFRFTLPIDGADISHLQN